MESCDAHVSIGRPPALATVPDARELARAAVAALALAEAQVREFERFERVSRRGGAIDSRAVGRCLGRLAAAARAVTRALRARAVAPELAAALVRVADPWVMLAPTAQQLLERRPGLSALASALDVIGRARGSDDALVQAVDAWLLASSWARAFALGRVWLRDELVARVSAEKTGDAAGRSAGPLQVRLLAGVAPLAEYLSVELAGIGGRRAVVSALAREVPAPDLVVGWGELDGMVDADALRFLDGVHGLLCPGGCFVHLGLPHPGELSGLLPLFLDWPGGEPRTSDEVGALLEASAFAGQARVRGRDQALVRVVAERRNGE